MTDALRSDVLSKHDAEPRPLRRREDFVQMVTGEPSRPLTRQAPPRPRTESRWNITRAHGRGAATRCRRAGRPSENQGRAAPDDETRWGTKHDDQRPTTSNPGTGPGHARGVVVTIGRRGSVGGANGSDLRYPKFLLHLALWIRKMFSDAQPWDNWGVSYRRPPVAHSGAG